MTTTNIKYYSISDRAFLDSVGLMVIFGFVCVKGAVHSLPVKEKRIDRMPSYSKRPSSYSGLLRGLLCSISY